MADLPIDLQQSCDEAAFTLSLQDDSEKRLVN